MQESRDKERNRYFKQMMGARETIDKINQIKQMACIDDSISDSTLGKYTR